MTVKVLPSLLTIGNLLCGFAAIFYASRHNLPDPGRPFGLDVLTFGACLIFMGMLFDALDGSVARMTRSTSELGAQLDSMADMVTFGVAPAFIVIQLVNIGSPFFGTAMHLGNRLLDRSVLLIAGVYVACTALRLARFNAELANPEESDHMSFKGLPSPAAAGTVASLVLLYQDLVGDESSLAPYEGLVLVGISFIVAIAMVSNLRYSHLINRYLRGRAPFHYVAGSVIALIAMLFHPQAMLAAAFVAYGLSAPVMRLFKKPPASGAGPGSASGDGPQGPAEPIQDNSTEPASPSATPAAGAGGASGVSGVSGVSGGLRLRS